MKLLCLFGLLSVGNASKCMTVTTNPHNCQKVCQLTSGCRAWSWDKCARPGTSPRCWLKKATGFSVSSTRCAISGYAHWNPKYRDEKHYDETAFHGGDINSC